VAPTTLIHWPKTDITALQEIEYTHHLNIIDIGSQDNGDYCLKVCLQAIHLSRAGLVHGGLIFTMLDAALGRAVIQKLQRGYSSPTLEMKINYFRPACVGELTARGRIVNHSKKLCYAEGEVNNEEGKLIARATGTFFIKQL
jgi:acyl-CoA thioesterase